MGNILSYTCNGLGDRLLQSCADGDLVAVRQLLQEHSKLCYWYRLSDGATPLHIAAANGQLDIALRLIETASRQRHFQSPREADIAAKALQNMLNARNALGQSSLMLACRSGRADITKLLLANGANPLLMDSFQFKTCLHYAAQFGWGNCCTVLLGESTYLCGTQQLLRNHEIRGRDGRIKKFIDIDAQSGYTALHIAASHGHLETCKVLLKYGASLTRECHGSLRTPFSRHHRMPLMGRPHVTSLHIAAARRNIPMCRAMLQAYALFVASNDSAVGGGQPAFDIRTVRDHFDQRPVDIAVALNCAALAAMLDPSLPLHLATAGHGCQGPLGVQSLSALAATALRVNLIVQLKAIKKLEAGLASESSQRNKDNPDLARSSSRIPAVHPGVSIFNKLSLPLRDHTMNDELVSRAFSVDSAQSLSPRISSARSNFTDRLLDGQESPLTFRSHSVTSPQRRQSPLAHSSVEFEKGHLSHRSVQGHDSYNQASTPWRSQNESPDGTKTLEATLSEASCLSTHSCDHSANISMCDPLECGICLDKRATIIIDTCGHFVCSACAKLLCEGACSAGNPEKAPICPFCRSVMGNFTPRSI